MSFFKSFFHYLGLPFVVLAFGWKLLFIKRKTKKYLRDPESFPLEERYRYAYKIVKKVLYIYNVKITTKGFTKTPSIPCLFIANHKSELDPIILFKILYETPQTPYFKFIAKAELNTKSRFAQVFKLIDTVFIPRDDLRATLEIYKNQANIQKDKRSIVVFIEGTRIYDVGKLGDWHHGTLRIAYNSFAPIVPIVLYGTSGIKKEKKSNSKYKNKKRKIFVNCLSPIKSNNYLTVQPVNVCETIKKDFEQEYFRIHNLYSKDEKAVIFDEADEKPEEVRY